VKGVVIVGDERLAPAACALAERNGWPLLAEPAANASTSASHIPFVPLVLSPTFRTACAADLVVTFGRFGLSRPVASLVREAREHIAVSRTGTFDPLLTAKVTTQEAPDVNEPAPDGWFDTWREAGAAVGSVVEALDDLTSLTAVREIGRAATAQDQVLIAASRPVRDAEMTWRSCAGRVFMNRGANGIDGLVSTAWGIAAGTGRRTLAVMGDLGFLHDINGLLVPDEEPRPDLTFIVLDNNGGGIFSSLEQGHPRFADRFERIFGTPHGRDLAAISRAHGVEALDVASLQALRDALASPATGVRALIVRLPSRADEQRAHEDLIRAAAAVVAS
jgi:2-succinyl-5-enolpyruvyl-6-hydroxy-3-cyclohexene-1-carboxylate synthase